ncbi:1-deoxy-D-xylulose-5-phosphate synthase [Pseudobacteroides cellulosolvens]|uniref:1-deoxy-D-xylulose-5-phosphate synthase n=1 Tax=Pseudobacteroides cellulosolvens ATCC 35603 = DSM 2933 TaxID=398512 RepID=A0A0L6JLZ8_9FIRM|nr:1-deoxy-D-xylulose-5-phosphate synthase [Pseudobacteroides cellulosolvens]KNY26765.1 1-deoxy-D-xylulose-5-phosphate synthase [Pseudobacteroides cellulosolvens ATCC 35603 = DSM 2933]
MGGILNDINSPDDIKKLDINQLEELAAEIRAFLIDNVSKTGGHLASNLGIVELTLALHCVFNTPTDKIIWDVGHQSYVHKIITGRKDKFCTLRQLDGISGFPKVNECEHDAFNTGHSSTSISAALGMAKARDIRKEKYSVIALIGDGALTGGMAFEALNDAGRSPNNLIVILNDNEMSISKNVGGLSKYLRKIRTEPFYFKVKEDLDIILNKIPAIGRSAVKALGKVKGSVKYMIMPGIFFEELGFKYFGPIDGHDLVELNEVLTRVKTMKGPILLHVCTQKGRGYTFAEESPHLFHGISPFEIETGEVLSAGGPSYSDVFGSELTDLAETDENIVAITAAMPNGTGLDQFSKRFHDRFFDVGIAEQHAVTFAAGLARNGLKPVFAVYSSFLQRSYDQLLHDVALQNLHVVFGVDRAGIVGEDGETHQGLYDLSFLSHIPNFTIMAPCDYDEMRKMIRFAFSEHTGPVAIRYPRGKGKDRLIDSSEIKLGQGVLYKEGSDLTFLSIGTMFETALKVTEELTKLGVSVELINARFVKPLDVKLIVNSVMKTKKMITLEDNTITGGFGSSVLEMINQRGINVKSKLFGFPDQPIIHGSKNQLFKRYKLDAESLVGEILKLCKKQ